MGFPDFNDDGRTSMAERAQAYMIIDMMDNDEQQANAQNSPGGGGSGSGSGSGGAEGPSCAGCLMAMVLVPGILVVLSSIVSCAR